MSSYGQGTDITSLVFSLDTVRSQTSKVDILIALADETFSSDLQQSLEYSQEALTIATSIDYLKGIAATHKFLGIGHAEKGGFVEAMNHLDKALESYQKLGDSLGVADVYNNLGNQYSYGENDVEARRYYDLALSIYESKGVQNKISGINNNIGTLYLDAGKPDSALIFLNRAIASNLEVKNEDGLATNYTNLGYAYAEMEDYEKAIESYLKCLEIGLKTNNKSIETVAYLNLGDSYMYQGKLEEAIESTTRGLNLAKEHGYVYSEYIGDYTLGEIYEKKGDFKMALSWFKEAERINESLINSDNQAAMMNFQSEQLKKAQRAEIERINMLNEQELKAERFKNYMLLTAAASVLLILLGTSYYFLKRHRIMLKMSAQNEKIQEQSDQIMQQAQDISAVNDTLRDRNLRLRKLNEEKNYLMSVVAHDLKSPLNQINGLVNVIKLTDSNLTEEQKECLNNIYFASDRLSEMVSKVLNREAIDADQVVISKSNIDVKELLTDVAQNFSGLAARKGIQIHKVLSSEKMELFTDRQYLQQIVDNLLSNAIKFSPKESEVIIKGEIEERHLIIEVKDHGPGLTEEDMENLFKEHMILSAKPTGDEISTGLGLSIVKNYAEKLGGEVWAESEFGQGASFKVKFPQA